MEISPEEMQICLDVLQKIASSNGTIERSQRFNSLVSKVAREGRKYEEREKRQKHVEEDKLTMASTGMVRIQRDAIAPALALPAPEDEQPSRRLNIPEACYICKEPFVDLHFFYHLLCPKCADYNWKMRSLTSDLRGRTALVTGGRVKIGHQTVLRLLRDGCRVILTTRFPHAAARRLHGEPDSADWHDRIHIYGLDLRNLPAIEAFSRHMLDNEASIDIVIHNAAQTIKRPAGFYNEMVELERNPQAALTSEAMSLVVQGAPSTLAISDASALLPALPTGESSSEPSRDILPSDRLEDNEERADSRDMNSWLLPLDQVGPQELLEVQLVNSVAPFLLNARLKPLLLRSPHERRFIVNVSAMEGQFARRKTIYHPHTNMAKAALNMMTRTSGDDYARDNIYMTSVDTGWVTDENPTPKRTKKQDDTGFYPPLDIVDGMARIYHPVAEGINNPNTPYYGIFLKDYAPTPW